MKLFSAAPSFKFTGSDRQGVEIPDSQMAYDFGKLKWNEGEITVEEAFSTIEKTMYPFKEVLACVIIQLDLILLFVCLIFKRFHI